MYYSTFILWFDHFLDSGAEIFQIFHCFLRNLKKSKRHSEINWPLAGWFCTCKGSVLVLITAWPKTLAALQLSNRLRPHLLGRCKRGSSNPATATICYLFNHFENFNLWTQKLSAVMTLTTSNTVARVSNFPTFCYCFAQGPTRTHAMLFMLFWFLPV